MLLALSEIPSLHVLKGVGDDGLAATVSPILTFVSTIPRFFKWP